MKLESLNSVIDSINLFAGFLAFTIVIKQVLSPKKLWINYIIILLYLSYGVIILSFHMEMTGKMLEYPFLIGTSWPFHSFNASSFYLYVKVLVNPSLRLTKKYLISFLPGLLYILTLTPSVYALSTPEKISILLDYKSFTIISFYNLIFFNVPIIIFVVLSIKELRLFWSKESLKNTQVFRIVFILLNLAIIGVILNAIGLITESILILRIDSLIFNMVLFTPFLLSYRYPGFMHNLSVEISKEKYRQSQLGGLDVDSVITRLMELIEIEKIFTDPELNMEKISEELQISKHQLSEILNNRLQVDFKNFINTCRINEAKKLFTDNSEDTILQIAFSVGFNSKTAFNTAFKKITSTTPSEYRKKNP